MSASSGFGGVSIYPVPPPPWTASFGTFLLCVRRSGERARIDDVRVDVVGSPLRVRHVLRVVPPEPARQPGFVWVPYGSSTKAFPHRRGEARPYGGTPHPVKGAVVTQTCDDVHGAQIGGYTDLLTELTVDGRGAEVKRTMVDYHSGGKRYTLVIRWEMTACGFLMREHCGS